VPSRSSDRSGTAPPIQLDQAIAKEGAEAEKRHPERRLAGYVCASTLSTAAGLSTLGGTAAPVLPGEAQCSTKAAAEARGIA
jgi:hypothetical protein